MPGKIYFIEQKIYGMMNPNQALILFTSHSLLHIVLAGFDVISFLLNPLSYMNLLITIKTCVYVPKSYLSYRSRKYVGLEQLI